MIVLELSGQHISKKIRTEVADLLYLPVRRVHELLLRILLMYCPRPFNIGAGAPSPLIACLRERKYDLIGLLLHEGLSPNRRDPHGKTPLEVAASLGLELIVQSLIGAGAKVNYPLADQTLTPLAAAAAAGELNIAPLLCECGSKADPPFRLSHKPLQCAVIHGHVEVADLLLERGAELNPLLCGPGKTPLQAAAQSGRIECLDLLISKGANINASLSPSGATALQYASRYGHTIYAEKLLSSSAAINDPSTPDGGLNALQSAARCGRLDLV